MANERVMNDREMTAIQRYLATLTGQPSPPLAGLRSAHRRPEFAVPDTVTSYSPARTDVPAVVDVSAVARAAS